MIRSTPERGEREARERERERERRVGGYREIRFRCRNFVRLEWREREEEERRAGAATEQARGVSFPLERGVV